MYFHKKTEYEDVELIIMNKEANWMSFMWNAEHNIYLKNKQEAVMLIRELQEYLNCDFPYYRNKSKHDIINAFELVCRVAISLGESEEFQAEYITSKLYGALKFLKNK